jgi:hypothetical protein
MMRGSACGVHKDSAVVVNWLGHIHATGTADLVAAAGEEYSALADGC